jgi:putative endonuclease
MCDTRASAHMPTPMQILGKFGEAVAEAYFVARGAEVLARNFIAEWGEVDIIVMHDGELIAVEVKTRNVNDLDEPEESVGRIKLRRIIRAFSVFAAQRELYDIPWHIDLVAIQTDDAQRVVRFSHLRDIWPP